jgi:hypothetical protein
MHNKKFFPSDFFACSPKYGKSWGNSGVTRSAFTRNTVTRSAARNDTWSLNRSNQEIDNSVNKSLINPFKMNIKNSSIKWRSLSKNKARPQSYRVKKHKHIHWYNEDVNESFVGNISVLNPCGIDDSFTSFRNENNVSSLSKDPGNVLMRIPLNNKSNLGRKFKNLKFKKGLKLRKPKTVKINPESKFRRWPSSNRRDERPNIRL